MSDFATGFGKRMLLGYAGVTTADQDLESQLDALRRAGCKRVVSDRASSARGNRQELAGALSQLREGDALVTWTLDRLGRTVRQHVQFNQELKGRGVGFRGLTDGIETSAPHGPVLLTLMAALADKKRDLLPKRSRVGLAAARARGRERGRRPKLSLPQIERAKRLPADPEMRVIEVCRRARRLWINALSSCRQGRE